MGKTIYVTEEGFKKLKADLDQMKNVERPAISRSIGEARDKGDISENAEYDAAKEAQGLLEMKIAHLEDQVANCRIINESKIDISKVQILSKVKIKNKTNKSTLSYMLVAESEANLKEGKISINTPIAKSLIGKKVGEVVEVTVPSGKMLLEILEISR